MRMRKKRGQGSTGGGPPRLARQPVLSSTEIAVLACLLQGKSHAAIIDDLKMEEGSLESHIRSILSKLDAPDRRALMELATGLTRTRSGNGQSENH
jgi:DNA-binding NarL/FixJ family response regulator